MSFFELLLLSIGLAMDCFAVSIANGAAHKKFEWGGAISIAVAFGFFQGIMPFLGWLLGINFAEIIGNYDHWFAFGILGYLGLKMVKGSFKKEEENDNNTAFSSKKTLFMLALATSIDALATGLIFIPLGNMIVYAMLIIGVVSFVFSMLGVCIGVFYGNKFNVNIELIGGLILIAIGTKILVEHTIV